MCNVSAVVDLDAAMEEMSMVGVRHDWRQNYFTTPRGFCRCDTSAAWSVWWALTPSWLTETTGHDGACQQPCTLPDLSDVVSTHDSASSVEQWTTQKYCPITVYFPPVRRRSAPCHAASDWLWIIFEVFQFFVRLADEFNDKFLWHALLSQQCISYLFGHMDSHTGNKWPVDTTVDVLAKL